MRRFFSRFIEKLKSNPEVNPKESLSSISKPLEEQIEEQITLLNSTNLKVKLKAIEGLQNFNSKKVLEAMVEAMKDPREEIKWALTEAIKNSRNPIVIPKLLMALNFPNQWLPSRVAEICLSFGDKALPYLLKELKGNKEEIKPFILEIIGELKNPEAVGDVKRLYLKSEDNPELQQKAVEAVGKIGSPEGRGIVLKALEKSEVKLKVSALQALTALTQNEDGEIFLNCLMSDDWLVRITAGQSLKKLGWNIDQKHLKTLAQKTLKNNALVSVIAEIRQDNKVS